MAYRGSRMIGTSRVFPAPDPNVPVPVPTKIFSSSSIVEKMMLNCSGCTTLQDIVNLDLSNRRISTLDPAVFSRMSSLVDLNVTNNRLTGFPLSLGLRHLKKLNCNNNLLRSVQTLEQFPNLDELHIENNELTVADQYIVVYMLPKLKILNGKEVDLRETILNMEETLQEQVHVLWAESCAPLLKDPMSKAEIQMLEQQFVELLKNQVQFGPDALQEFTHHMLTVLAEKCVMQMTAHLRKLTDASAPISKVQIVVRNEGSGSRSMNNGTATSAQLSKAVEKRQLGQNSTQEPASKKNKSIPNTGQKPKVPKTTAKRKMIEAQKNQGGQSQSGMEILEVIVKEEEPMDEGQETNQECGIAYEPMHLLRCHSVDNDPTDSKTNVWKCAFEPNPDVAGASKWTVATCGSNQVCVIDCNSGKVLKKYQHTKEKDEFYCIAWTKLMVIMEDKRRPTTVLAAAGIKGSIKLLHTTQLLCYAEIKCERRARPINCLLFHPNRPNWLFCGSEDISVFDIGIPYGPDLKCRHKKLFVLEAPGRVLGLVICPKSNFLMAGCDNGCYGWGLDTPKGEKRAKEPNVEFLLPSKARLLGDEEEEMDDDGEKEGDMIDGLALLKEDLIASKVACDGSIHVWSLSQSRKQQGEGGREVTINPLYTLEWCDSDSVYLDIGTWPGCGVLVSGDDQGEVWVYDVSKRTGAKNKKTVKPSQLLPWPENNEQELVEEKAELNEKAEPSVKEESSEKAVDGQQEQPSLASSQEADTREAAAATQKENEQADEAKDVEVVAESSEKAVAEVLEDVVSKVVGEESQDEAKDKSNETPTEQVNGENVEEKDEKEEEKDEKEEDTKAAEEKQDEGGKPEGQNVEGTSEEKVEEVTTEKVEEVMTEKVEEVMTEKVEEVTTEKVEEVTTEKVEEVTTEKVEEVTTEKEQSDESKVEKVEEEKAEKADAVVEETPKKRGRGRPRKNPVGPNAPPKPEPSPAPVTSSAAQRAKSRREQKIQEANKAKAEEDNKLTKLKSKKAAEKAGKAAGKAVGKAAGKAAERAAEKAEKAAQIKEKKAQMKEKKAQMQAAAAKAKEERAREKEERAEKARERAKEKAEIAELRQSLKKPKKGSDDVMDIANTEDRIIVNDVAISSDCKFIVSVTNKNLICIWQRV